MNQYQIEELCLDDYEEIPNVTFFIQLVNGEPLVLSVEDVLRLGNEFQA